MFYSDPIRNREIYFYIKKTLNTLVTFVRNVICKITWYLKKRKNCRKWHFQHFAVHSFVHKHFSSKHKLHSLKLFSLYLIKQPRYPTEKKIIVNDDNKSSRSKREVQNYVHLKFIRNCYSAYKASIIKSSILYYFCVVSLFPVILSFVL